MAWQSDFNENPNFNMDFDLQFVKVNGWVETSTHIWWRFETNISIPGTKLNKTGTTQPISLPTKTKLTQLSWHMAGLHNLEGDLGAKYINTLKLERNVGSFWTF